MIRAGAAPPPSACEPATQNSFFFTVSYVSFLPPEGFENREKNKPPTASLVPLTHIE